MRKTTAILCLALSLALPAGARAAEPFPPPTISVTGHAAERLAAGADEATRLAAYERALDRAAEAAKSKAQRLAHLMGVRLGAVDSVFEQSDPLEQPCEPRPSGSSGRGDRSRRRSKRRSRRTSGCVLVARIGVTYRIG